MQVPVGSRTSFAFGGVINWFPGHMAKALRNLNERVALSDIIIEVRDARVRPVHAGCCNSCGAFP
jgi:hypothetical protein